IHRYLRELEAAEAQTLSGLDRLSRELHDFVGQLAVRLHQEAEEKIALASEEHEQERRRLEAQWNQTRQELAQVSRQNESLAQEIVQYQNHLTQAQQQLNAEQIEAGRLRQAVNDLKCRLDDKDF